MDRQAVHPGDENDLRKTVGTIAEGVSGKKLSPEEMKQLERDLMKNPEAQKAIETMGNSWIGAKQIKYCPVDGERYAPNIELCPTHNVILKTLDE